MKNADFVGFDLCVLASSDHTIITYGSFGLWGAILSRGDVIAAKGTNNETYTEVNMLCYVVMLINNIMSAIFIYIYFYFNFSTTTGS